MAATTANIISLSDQMRRVSQTLTGKTSVGDTIEQRYSDLRDKARWDLATQEPEPHNEN